MNGLSLVRRLPTASRLYVWIGTVALLLALIVAAVRAQAEEESSPPRRSPSATPAKSPTASPKPSAARKKKKASPSPSPTTKKKKSPAASPTSDAEDETPKPKAKPKSSPTGLPKSKSQASDEDEATPKPKIKSTVTASPLGKRKIKKEKEEQDSNGESAEPTPTASPKKSPSAKKSPSSSKKKKKKSAAARSAKKSPSPRRSPKPSPTVEETSTPSPPRATAVIPTPPRATAASPSPALRSRAVDVQDQPAQLTIEKSGFEGEQGYEPPPPTPEPRRFLFWRLPRKGPTNYRYLTRSVRAEIDNARVQKRRWQFIVVHNSGSRQGSAKVFDYYHRRVRKMKNGMAYHFVIGNGRSTGNGQIEIGDRWRRQINGGHVHSDYLNNIAIGICLVGDFNRDQPNKAQMESCEELIKYLRQRCGKIDGREIPIRPHKEMNPPRWSTDCPGDVFPYGWFRRF